MSAASKSVNTGRKPMWDEKQMWKQTRTQVIVLASVVGVLSVALIAWVLFFAQIAEAAPNILPMGADLAVVLAPVLAAAAGVERMLETIFNTIEGVWRKAVAYLGYGMRWLKAAETEVDDARQWLQNASTLYNGIMASYNEQVKEVLKGLNASAGVVQLPEQIAAEVNRLKNEADHKAAATKMMLEDAQKQLDTAEKQLGSLTDSAEYKSAKSAASIILGLMLGVVVAALGQIQMFAMLGIAAVPASADVLITGLVIGSGTYPVHSLVGILQQSKDTLDSIKGFFNRSAPQQKSTVTAEIPRSAATGGATLTATTTAQSTEETPNP